MSGPQSKGPIIDFGVDGRVYRLRRPDDWRRLIEDGLLKRDTLVNVERLGEPITEALAGDVPELAELFQPAPKAATVAAPPSPPAPKTPDLKPPLPPIAVAPKSPPPVLWTPTSSTTAPSSGAGKPGPKPTKPATNPTTPPPKMPPPPPPEAGSSPAPSPVQEPAPLGAAPEVATTKQPSGCGALIALVLIVGLPIYGLSRCASGGKPATATQNEDPGAAAGVTRYVVRPMRILSAPAGGRAVGKLARGDEVTGEPAQDASFFRLTDGPHTGAYVWAANLSEQAPPRLGAAPASLTVGEGEGVALHAAPTDESPVLGTLPAGSRVKVAGAVDDDWLEVWRGKSRGVGYVRKTGLTDTASSPSRPKTEAPAPTPDEPAPSAAPQPEAPAPDARPPAVVTPPVWLRRPSGEDLGRFFPERAQRLERGGSAAMRCTVGLNGRLRNCVVVSEDPAGLGFGDATLKLAPYFLMRPGTEDGVPVDGGQVTIPIRWSLQ